MNSSTNPLSKLFSDSLKNIGKTENDNEPGHLIIDMYEKEDHYYITAPAAGVSPDQIELELNENYILIKGQRKKDIISEQNNYVIQECYWGAFVRQIDFPSPIDPEKATATFKDGMLNIVLAKAKSSKTRNLKIKTI